jgi:pyrroloquinoline quinone biosynthesis protein B
MINHIFPTILVILATLSVQSQSVVLKVLGTAQDAGYPQAACQKECCKYVWPVKTDHIQVSCMGIVDKKSNQSWIIDATPDFPQQLYELEKEAPLTGIFLTHAHIGHYTGLIYLGREVMGADNIPVHAMPRMTDFLGGNGPWSQLVKLNNIALKPLKADSTIVLTSQLKVTPLQVPHRDEFSETVGYLIESKNKSALFIPDIDKWHLWDRDIVTLIKQVDYALLDATFFANGEIPNRDMSEIPHPFVEESMQLFSQLSDMDKAKVYFIHFNHTNPLLQKGSIAQKEVLGAGFNIAEEGMILGLD